MGYNSRRPHRVPLISTTNWKNVVWSDESRLLLRHSDGRVRIWRKQNEDMDPSWWCNGVGDVFLAHFRSLSANWASFKCQSIVSDHVHPFMATMSPSSDGYFQQDNAPCHKTRITMSQSST